MKFVVKEKFNHFDTKQPMYRVQVLYSSGGMMYSVFTREELEDINKNYPNIEVEFEIDF